MIYPLPRDRLYCFTMSTANPHTSLRLRFLSRLQCFTATRGAGFWGAFLLITIFLACLLSLPWTLCLYDLQNLGHSAKSPDRPPSLGQWFGTDLLGRSVLARCMLGGLISLSIGIIAAGISIVIGVAWGMTAGYLGGRIDNVMMRVVDILYGLPYILLVVILNISLMSLYESYAVAWGMHSSSGQMLMGLACLIISIAGVSWLTMARVIRGQTLSLKTQGYVQAAKAAGAGPGHIMVKHILPNLVGPIVVYATLTVPAAILQESFLSFLGIGVRDPLPSWGNLASESLFVLHQGQGWWMLFWPCLLLGLTLMALNFLGEGLRVKLDPKKNQG